MKRFSKILLAHLLFVSCIALASFAEDAPPFPKMGAVGDVTVEPGEGLLGACSVGVKLTARGLHLRERAELGRLAMPAYPESLLSAGIVGEAEVAFVLMKDGSVTDARVLRAANPEFGSSALESVNRWKFKPLKSIRHTEPVLVTATFVFSIFYD